jgi:hypothetical protein
MMPPLINPNSPDLDKVRRTVQEKIETSEALDARAAEPTPGSTGGTPTPRPTASPSRNAKTDDLGKVCSA